MINARKKKDYAYSEFFNIIVLSSQIIGITVGVFTVNYEGEKVTNKLDFMEDESISGLLKKFLFKSNLKKHG